MHLIPLITIIILARQNYHVLIYGAVHNIYQCLATLYSQKYDTTVLFGGNILIPYCTSEWITKSLCFLLTSMISLGIFCIKLMRCASQNQSARSLVYLLLKDLTGHCKHNNFKGWKQSQYMHLYTIVHSFPLNYSQNLNFLRNCLVA